MLDKIGSFALILFMTGCSFGVIVGFSESDDVEIWSVDVECEGTLKIDGDTVYDFEGDEILCHWINKD